MPTTNTRQSDLLFLGPNALLLSARSSHDTGTAAPSVAEQPPRGRSGELTVNVIAGEPDFSGRVRERSREPWDNAAVRLAIGDLGSDGAHP